MKKKVTQKHWLSRAVGFLLALALAVSPCGSLTAHAAGEVCALDGAPMATLDLALAAISDGSLHTITLLTDITRTSNISVSAQNIRFDLNGHTLNVQEPTGVGLRVDGGGLVSIVGSGSLNVKGAVCGLLVDGVGSSAMVTNAEQTNPGDCAVLVTDHGTAMVLQNVTAAGSGVSAATLGTVDVGGDVISDTTANSSVSATDGGQIHIGGNVRPSILAAGRGGGILAHDASSGISSIVAVDGNVISEATSVSGGAYAYQTGEIVIGGSLAGAAIGAQAAHSGKVTIKNGDVEATASGSTGINVATGGRVEVQKGTVRADGTGINANGSSDNTDSGTPSTVYVKRNVESNGWGVDASDHHASVTVDGNVSAGTDMGALASLSAQINIGGDVQGASYGVNATGLGTSIHVGGDVTGTAAGETAAYAEGQAEVTVTGSVTNDHTGSYGATAAIGGLLVINGDINGDTGTAGGGAVAETGGIVTANGLINTGGAYARIGSLISPPIDYANKGTENFDESVAIRLRDGYFTYTDLGRLPTAPSQISRVRVKTTMTVTTGDPHVSEGTADLSGSADAGSGPPINSNIIERGFVYGSSLNPALDQSGVTEIHAGTGSGSFTGSLSPVGPSTTYHVRAYAINGAGVVYGADKVIGGAVRASVMTSSVSGVTKNGATLSATVMAGSTAITQYGFVYGTSHSPTVLSGTRVGGSGSAGSFTAALTGLSASTTYYARTCVYDGGGPGPIYGSEFSFTTSGGGSTGGGSSGSSSSSSGSELTVRVLDSGGSLVKSIAPELGNNGKNAIVKVDAAALTEAFDKSKKDDKGTRTVTLDIPKIGGVKTYEPVLPVSFFAEDNAAKAIIIKTPIAALTVPGNILSGDDAGAQTVSLTITAGDKSGLDASAKAQIGDHPILTLDLTKGGKSIVWSNKNAPMTVAVPYVPNAEEAKAPEFITAWYIDGSGKALEVPGGRYDAKTGTVIFRVTHFSQCAIAFTQKTFGDIGRYPWAQKQIEVLASKGIISGSDEKEFSPGTAITRADYLMFLVNTLGLSAEFESNFDDVKQGTAYFEAVGIAKELGVTTGVGGNRFEPEETVSRQDLMVMTCRALEKFEGLKAAGDTSALDQFNDKANVSDYAGNDLATLVKDGLITGSGNQINPKAQMTRAEAAVFLYRIYNKY